MDAQEVLKLFDSCWFEMEIFKKQSSSSTPSSSDSNPDRENKENPSNPGMERYPTIHKRSMSDQLSSSVSFLNSGSFSPDSVLVCPKLRTILSGKEISEEEEKGSSAPEIEETQNKNKVVSSGDKTKRVITRRKKGTSKSLSDLEFEELKGFMDLGFVFSEEDNKDSRLVEIIPGLQRLGKKDDDTGEEDHSEIAVSRPYLSEAWEVLDRRDKEKPLTNWRFPALGNETDMKDNLRWWAHTVASTVR